MSRIIIYGNKVKNIIKDRSQIKFIATFSEKLRISDINYDFNVVDYIRDMEGYSQFNVNGTIRINPITGQLEYMYLAYESIANTLNNVLFKNMYNLEFIDEITKGFIRFLLAHELVHVYQYKFNKENLIAAYNTSELKKNEDEANAIASDYMSLQGEAYAIIARIGTSIIHNNSDERITHVNELKNKLIEALLESKKANTL